MRYAESHPSYPVDDGKPALPEEVLETREHELPTRGDREVFQWLGRLAKADDRFKDVWEQEIDPLAFQEHRRRLAEFNRTCDAIGLETDDADRDLINRFFGFHREGRSRVADIAHAHGIKETDVTQRVRTLSLELGRAGLTART